ncbi:hypothetical protein FBY41_0915 [Humibacillus xanthopallidus]|uniref:Dolichyl-phosphate-mannose-protein mannosyltransferase n=2 Tax=Humibacillus xanthopallidus TaxID=412689 RepID=A0A543I1S2_9MICO|nr:hypothetical protein FBY41_0915 [Humibacillus xanthopallidus]
MLRRALPGLVVAFIVIRMLQPISDSDTFWHMVAGDWLRDTHRFVVEPDPWSSTASRPWILNQWLPELFMSWFQEHFGLPGVAWLHVFALVGVYLTVWWVCRARASMLVSAIVSVAAFGAMSGSLAARPQVVSFAFAAVATGAWLKSADDLKPRWWLIAMTWVWACSHGFWFFSPVIGLTVVAGLALDRRLDRRSGGRLLLVCLGSAVAGALTPVGPILVTSPFQVRDVTQYIDEWQSVGITDPRLLVLLCLVALAVVIGLRRGERTPWHLILLIGLAAGLGLTYARTIAVGAAVIAPIAAGALHEVTRLKREPRRAGPEFAIVGIIAAAALTVSAVTAPAVAATPGLAPNGLNAQLDALPKGTVLCNAWAYGGWLIWRHPDLKVTMDGRAEIYTGDYVTSYVMFELARPGWKEYVSRAGCDYALLQQGKPIVEALTSEARWSKVAEADGGVLLRRPG